MINTAGQTAVLQQQHLLVSLSHVYTACTGVTFIRHMQEVLQFYLLGSSFNSKGAAKATMIGDRNCNTTESDNGISCMDVYNRKIDTKLHSPLNTSILCLHTR